MKVLVAIDQKPSSQAIVDALVKMHWYEGTEIHLISAVAPDNNHASYEQHESRVAQELESLASELRKSLRQCEITSSARPGSPEAVILEQADEHQADLIVLGSNCKNTLERLFLGSVCQAVIDGANCPVVVAKTPCCLARELSPAFRNILVPIDNSPFSDAAIRWLGNFSWAPNTEFIVAAVAETDTDPIELEKSLKNRAVALSKTIQSNNIKLATTSGVSSQSIIDLAKEHYSDLIVMGAHGRSGLKKLILGEIAQAVSHGAPCAVAIIGGLLADDGSWIRTEAFPKLKPADPAPATWSNRYDDNQRDTPAVIPGGF
jgi:nucleotide-binding universal stress UspA family protein